MARAEKKSKVRQPKFGGCLAFGFFGIFAAAGTLALYYLTWQPLAGIVRARGWEKTTATSSPARSRPRATATPTGWTFDTPTRPSGNRSMEVADESTRRTIREVTFELIGKGEELTP